MGEMLSPGVRVFSGQFMFDLSDIGYHLSGVSNSNSIRRCILRYIGAGANERVLPDFNPRHNSRVGCDHSKGMDMDTYKVIRGRSWIVGQNDIGKNPDKIINNRQLADMDIAVHTDIISDFAVALNIRQCTDTDMVPNFRTLTYCNPVSGLKAFSNDRSGINNGATPDQRAFSNLQRMFVWFFIGAKIHPVFSKDTIRTDKGIVIQGYMTADNRITVNVYIVTDRDIIFNNDIVAQYNTLAKYNAIANDAVYSLLNSFLLYLVLR